MRVWLVSVRGGIACACGVGVEVEPCPDCLVWGSPFVSFSVWKRRLGAAIRSSGRRARGVGWPVGYFGWGGVGSVSGAAARDPRGAREKSTGNGRKRAFFCVASVLCRPSPACVAGAAVGRNTARFLEGRFVAAASSETREFVKLLVRERANNRVEPSRLAGMRKRRAGYYLKRIKGCLERLNNFFSGQDLDLIDFSATLI